MPTVWIIMSKSKKSKEIANKLVWVCFSVGQSEDKTKDHVLYMSRQEHTHCSKAMWDEAYFHLLMRKNAPSPSTLPSIHCAFMI